jgi:NAD/NADP transhydrogenase beta subunit
LNTDEQPIGAFAIGLHRAEQYIGVFIGAVTFTGSLIAFGKLDERIRSKPLIIGGNLRHVFNGVVDHFIY